MQNTIQLQKAPHSRDCNSLKSKIYISFETGSNLLTVSSYKIKIKLHTSNIQQHRKNTSIPKWKNPDIRKLLGSTKMRFQQGKHQILQFHVQHLGLTKTLSGPRKLRWTYPPAMPPKIHIASVLGWFYSVLAGFLDICPIILASPIS